MPKNHSRNLRLRTTIAAALLLGSGAASADYLVTSGDNAGAGTLREALGSGEAPILIDPSVVIITIEEPLVYDSTDALEIHGTGQTVMGGDFTLFQASEGADLLITDLSFEGPGNYSLDNQDGGKGIELIVPTNRTGTVSLHLDGVTVRGVGNHGIHVSDCNLAVCGSGSGGAGGGSDAGVFIRIENVTVDNVGNGNFDADGLRVDERDLGGIVLEAVNSDFMYVGADGIELDEGQDGDVLLAVRNLNFNMNGAYCEQNDVPETEVELEDPGTQDDRCLEWDDGEYVLDLDDAFDVDEAGDGSILGWVKNVWAANNLDEGLDFDEEGEGGYDVELAAIHGQSNGGETVKMSEEDEGGIVALLHSVSALDNDGDGIELEEEDGGSVDVTIHSTVAMGNDGNGIKVEEADDGDFSLIVTGTTARDNEDPGIEAEQDDDGEGWATFRGGDIDEIDDSGVMVDQKGGK